MHIHSYYILSSKVEEEQGIIDFLTKIGSDTSKHNERLEEHQYKLNEEREYLINLKSSLDTVTRYQNLLTVLNILNESIVYGRYGTLPLRNQGLSIPNYFYTLILRDIESVFIYEYLSYSSSYFTYSYESDLDIAPIKKLLAELIHEIKVREQPSNYVELDILHKQIRKRVSDVAEAELIASQNKQKAKGQ